MMWQWRWASASRTSAAGSPSPTWMETGVWTTPSPINGSLLCSSTIPARSPASFWACGCVWRRIARVGAVEPAERIRLGCAPTGNTAEILLEWRLYLVAQPEVERELGRHLEIVLDITPVVFVDFTQACRLGITRAVNIAQQETGEGVACADSRKRSVRNRRG